MKTNRSTVLALWTLTLLTLASAAQHRPAPRRAPDVNVDVRQNPESGPRADTVYGTIQTAIDRAPNPGPGRLFVHIYPGTYYERVMVSQNHPRVTLIGMGSTPADVTVSNALNARQAGGTLFTETLSVNGDDFQADNLTVENTAGNTGQAVAAAVRSDRAIFKHCRFLGFQNTLLADFGRQYYTASYIAGGVDFIFGNAAAVFDHSEIHALSPGFLAAHARTRAAEPTGFVISNSRVTSSMNDATDLGARRASNANDPVPGARSSASSQGTFSLGRPMRPYARIVYLDTALPNGLNPAGWSNWSNPDNEGTAFFAEYRSTGPGASPKTRVPWSHQISAAEARAFQTRVFLRGRDNWNPEAEAARLP